MLAVALAACGETPAAEALRLALPGSGPAPAPAAVEGQALVLLAPRQVALAPVGPPGPRRLWRGDGNIALATEGARIVATAGLPQTVMATRFDGPDPLDDPRALLGREATARRTVDLAGADREPASMRFGVVLDCALRGAEAGAALLVEERCSAGELAFTNRFWADPATGAVLRSEQWAGEGVGMLVLQAQGI